VTALSLGILGAPFGKLSFGFGSDGFQSFEGYGDGLHGSPGLGHAAHKGRVVHG
jgi:hypothetical protein